MNRRPVLSSMLSPTRSYRNLPDGIFRVSLSQRESSSPSIGKTSAPASMTIGQGIVFHTPTKKSMIDLNSASVLSWCPGALNAARTPIVQPTQHASVIIVPTGRELLCSIRPPPVLAQNRS